MNEERKYLEFVIKYVNEKLNLELESFDELELNYRRYPDRFLLPYKLACNKIKILKNGLDKPYFARIDFKDNEEINKVYIGKYGIMDENANSLVVDWRAPISNLYYDSEIGQANYESPSGIISGELLLKRQFEIENGVLNSFYDVDLVSNDELLQKYLNENNDARLKNIVSTIQKEQNLAIRIPLNKNIIVQGVAGSGKTTIALHRIAYLVYNYRNSIKNRQYLVIGPNDVFLKYIKSVLPDLDVSDIEQSTYEEFAKEIIGLDFKIKSSNKYLNKYLSGKTENNIPKFKSSLDYMAMLDYFIEEYFDEICNKDLEMNSFKILEKNELKGIFKVSLEDTKNLNKAIDRFVLLASKYIEKNEDEIIKKVNLQTKEKTNGLTNEERNEIISRSYTLKDEIKKGCKSLLRKYVSRSKIDSIKLYKKFILNIADYDFFDYKYLDELKRDTLENIKNNEYDFEDLAPLMHIKYRLGLTGDEKSYRHTVIDEAQDLGVFNYYVLKEILENSTFSIFGDIAQSIYDYRSIDSWDEVVKVFEDAEVLSFKKSYRTTDQIMEVANAVSSHLNIEESELSVRQGESVSFEQVDKDNVVTSIKEKIEKYKEIGYKTIAVISKYDLQSSYLNDDLSFEGMFISNIEDGTDVTNEKNNIATISNYLAKGLEFDAVIINNADEAIYNSNNPSDMKMLYVALTRALHKLDVIYTDEISKPLAKFVTNEKRNIINPKAIDLVANQQILKQDGKIKVKKIEKEVRRNK